MRIVNKTGVANDTKIIDDNGNDITGDLAVTKITVVAEVLKPVRVYLVCEHLELDIVGEEQKPQPKQP